MVNKAFRGGLDPPEVRVLTILQGDTRVSAMVGWYAPPALSLHNTVQHHTVSFRSTIPQHSNPPWRRYDFPTQHAIVTELYPDLCLEECMFDQVRRTHK